MSEGISAKNRPWVDAAVIEMVNIGRAPISVSAINLDIGAKPRWKLWQRHTVGMAPIAIHGGLADVGEVRLEAGRSVFAIFDCWPAIEAGRKVRGRVHLRASVLPAGRRAKRSRWSHRWRIRPDQQQLWPHGPEGDEVKLVQAVWREIAPIAPEAVYDVWVSIVGLLIHEGVDPKAIGILEVSNALDPILDNPGQRMWPSIHILAALRKHGQAGAWMPRLRGGELGSVETPPGD